MYLNLITSKFDTEYANSNQDLKQFLFAIKRTRADIIGAPRCTRIPLLALPDIFS